MRGGKLLEFFGSRVLKPYPKENLEIFKLIREKNEGLFVSEQLPEKRVIKSYKNQSIKYPYLKMGSFP